MKNSVQFITTNYCWGGSEQLWYAAAKHLSVEGYKVSAFIPNYDHSCFNDSFRDRIATQAGSRFVYPNRKQRLLHTAKLKTYHKRDLLAEHLKSSKPSLVVISKGNLAGDEDIPELCIQLNIPFIIVVHLVSELNWHQLNEPNRLRMAKIHEQAACTYFVSEKNREQFLLMIQPTAGTNTAIVFNPIRVSFDSVAPYPEHSEVFHCAVVGRIECYHKGLDILLEVLTEEKWQRRQLFYRLCPLYILKSA